MAVMLITPTEKLQWFHSETNSTLYYKRLTGAHTRLIQAKHTSKGIVDNQKVVDEVLDVCILDWDGVYDSHGDKVPFSTELIASLPETYKAEFISALQLVNPASTQLGNSDAS